MCVLCHFANVLQCDSGNMCKRRELTKVASRDDKDAKKKMKVIPKETTLNKILRMVISTSQVFHSTTERNSPLENDKHVA